MQLGEDVQFGCFLLCFRCKPELRTLAGSELNGVAGPQGSCADLLAVHECSVSTLCVLQDKLAAMSRDDGVVARNIRLGECQIALRGTSDYVGKTTNFDGSSTRTVDQLHRKWLGLSKLWGVHFDSHLCLHNTRMLLERFAKKPSRFPGLNCITKPSLDSEPPFWASLTPTGRSRSVLLGYLRFGRAVSEEWVAEGEGFEPPLPVRAKRFSRPPVSTTHTSLRVAWLRISGRLYRSPFFRSSEGFARQGTKRLFSKRGPSGQPDRKREAKHDGRK